MITICPTVTAYDKVTFKEQLNQVISFADRIHLDLMDGIFSPTKSPTLKELNLPVYNNKLIDLHLMYQDPSRELNSILKIKPNLVILHVESNFDESFIASLHKNNIKVGLAILARTNISDIILDRLNYFEQVLIFAGKLGYHGGIAELSNLDKVQSIKSAFPEIEIAWDGGVNSDNLKVLIDSGINVLNVGGYIQNSVNPQNAYDTLRKEIKNYA